jgi:hypothetical protein
VRTPAGKIHQQYLDHLEPYMWLDEPPPPQDWEGFLAHERTRWPPYGFTTKTVSAFVGAYEQMARKGELSPKMVRFLQSLAQQVKLTIPGIFTPYISTGEFGAIHKLFNERSLGQRGGFIPVLRIWDDYLGQVHLHMRDYRSRNPGSVCVTTRGRKFRVGGVMKLRRAWYGDVHRDGSFYPNSSFLIDAMVPIEELLVGLRDEPRETLKTYSNRTGKCCVCDEPLTSGRQMTAGHHKACGSLFNIPTRLGEIRPPGGRVKRRRLYLNKPK